MNETAEATFPTKDLWVRNCRRQMIVWFVLLGLLLTFMITRSSGEHAASVLSDPVNRVIVVAWYTLLAAVAYSLVVMARFIEKAKDRGYFVIVGYMWTAICVIVGFAMVFVP